MRQATYDRSVLHLSPEGTERERARVSFGAKLTSHHALSTVSLILRKLPRKLARQRIEAERLQDKLLQDYLKRKDTVEIVKEQVRDLILLYYAHTFT